MNKLTTKQINELITGVQLSAELPASSEALRHFVSVAGYAPSGNHRLDRTICEEKIQTTLFWVRDYEVLVVYLESDWEIPDTEIMNACFIEGIVGIQKLEEVLLEHVSEPTLLVSHWNSDAPL